MRKSLKQGQLETYWVAKCEDRCGAQAVGCIEAFLSALRGSATRVVGDSWCDGLHGVDIFDCNGLFGGGAGSIYH